jgi:hypothetical protein
MFKGKAKLNDPETNSSVATFTETCEHDAALMKVVLERPITGAWQSTAPLRIRR